MVMMLNYLRGGEMRAIGDGVSVGRDPRLEASGCARSHRRVHAKICCPSCDDNAIRIFGVQQSLQISAEEAVARGLADGRIFRTPFERGQDVPAIGPWLERIAKQTVMMNPHDQTATRSHVPRQRVEPPEHGVRIMA
jgi:hypothetical protein